MVAVKILATCKAFEPNCGKGAEPDEDVACLPVDDRTLFPFCYGTLTARLQGHTNRSPRGEAPTHTGWTQRSEERTADKVSFEETP